MSDNVDFATREKTGIEYLTALSKVTTTLADAQSTAVAGEPVSRAELSGAVEAVTAIDTRIGASLKTQERWAGLRAKIEALPDRNLTDSNAVFTAYSETADLLLALVNKVRESSNLNRDPDGVAFYLQDAAAEELPQVVIRAGRYNDLVVLAAKLPDPAATEGSDSETAAAQEATAARARAAADITAAQGDVAESAGDATRGLQAAVDTANSTTFGANVLRPLDSFSHSIDGLSAPNRALASGGIPNPVEVGKLRRETVSAATDLNGVLLRELLNTIDNRQSDTEGDRTLAVVSFVIALVLSLAGYLVSVARSLRRRRIQAERDGVPSAPYGGDGHYGRNPGGQNPGGQNPGGQYPPGGYTDPGGMASGVGEGLAARRERTGAPR